MKKRDVRREAPSARRIVIRMAVTVLLVAGLVVCHRHCSEQTFLIALIVTVALYTAVTFAEVSRSSGNKAKWGKEGEDRE